MMKKLVSLLICLCLLTSCACAEWGTPAPIGNDRVGYFLPDTTWYEFRSVNLSDEDIAELEASFGFVQYASLDLGMVILTMAVYPDMVKDFEDEQDMLTHVINVDYRSVAGDMVAPVYQAEMFEGLVPGYKVALLQVYDEDESEQSTGAWDLFFYIIDNGNLYRYEFEQVPDQDAGLALVQLVRTWTPVLP